MMMLHVYASRFLGHRTVMILIALTDDALASTFEVCLPSQSMQHIFWENNLHMLVVQVKFKR